MKVLLVIIVSTLITSCSGLINSGAIVEAQNALNHQSYEETLDYIEIAESFGNLSEENAAKLHYLRTQALEKLERYEEAAYFLRHIIVQHADSAYAISSQQKLDELKKLYPSGV